MKTRAQIIASIKSLASRSKTFRQDMQETLIDIAGHMVEHSEPSLAAKVLNDVGNGVNKVAIARWLGTYTAYRVVADKPQVCKAFMKEVTSGFTTGSNGENTLAREAHEAALREEAPNWWEDGEADDAAKVVAVFDALNKVETLLATIGKKCQAGEGTHLDLERYIRQAVEQYKADSIAKL